MSSSALPVSVPLSSPVFERANSSAVQVEIIKGIALSILYFGLARTGLGAAYSAPLFAIGASIAFPQWRPCLLLMVISIQDAPGQLVQLEYIGVAGIAGIMIFNAAINRSHEILSARMLEFRSLMRFGLIVVVYGICSGIVQHKLGLHEQSDTRPPFVIGGLMVMMILAGYLSHRELSADPLSSVRIQTALVAILLHVYGIAFLQVVMGPLYGSSPQGVAEMKQLFQMIDGGERGLARLTGPFLSPNILASVPGFAMLIWLRYQSGERVSVRFISVFFLAGMTAAYLGGARTMFVCYLCCTVAMTWMRSPQYTLLGICTFLPFIFILDIPWNDLLMLLRLKNLQSLGVRGEMWQMLLSVMDVGDWIFGYGITHFPVLIRVTLGYYGTDPHNWILSVCGMFGVLGLMFYLILARKLFRKCFAREEKERVIAICLLLLFVGREFANTQYVLNNSPLCCLSWLMISLVFFDVKEAGPGPQRNTVISEPSV